MNNAAYDPTDLLNDLQATGNRAIRLVNDLLSASPIPAKSVNMLVALFSGNRDLAHRYYSFGDDLKTPLIRLIEEKVDLESIEILLAFVPNDKHPFHDRVIAGGVLTKYPLEVALDHLAPENILGFIATNHAPEDAVALDTDCLRWYGICNHISPETLIQLFQKSPNLLASKDVLDARFYRHGSVVNYIIDHWQGTEFDSTAEDIHGPLREDLFSPFFTRFLPRFETIQLKGNQLNDAELPPGILISQNIQSLTVTYQGDYKSFGATILPNLFEQIRKHPVLQKFVIKLPYELPKSVEHETLEQLLEHLVENDQGPGRVHFQGNYTSFSKNPDGNSLEVHNDGSSVTPAILQRLRPNLHKLHLNLCLEGSLGLAGMLNVYLADEGCQLRSLSVFDLDFHEALPAIVAGLRRNSSIESIEIARGMEDFEPSHCENFEKDVLDLLRKDKNTTLVSFAFGAFFSSGQDDTSEEVQFLLDFNRCGRGGYFMLLNGVESMVNSLARVEQEGISPSNATSILFDVLRKQPGDWMNRICPFDVSGATDNRGDDGVVDDNAVGDQIDPENENGGTRNAGGGGSLDDLVSENENGATNGASIGHEVDAEESSRIVQLTGNKRKRDD